MEKVDFRTLSSSERYEFRKRAITLIKSAKNQIEIALFYGIRAATVCHWVKQYKLLGNKGLIDKQKGPKSENLKLLSKKHELEIQKMINDVMPDQLKLPYALWTRKAVKELVEREFGIVLAINTMGDYLRSWGFSPQKPKKKAYEQSSKISIFYLPSYSPEKNPDEYLNCDLKYGLSEKPAPRNQEQLRNNVEDHMNMLQKK